MLYADEVVDTVDLEVPKAEETQPTERELKMAEQLVESLSAPFEPEKYRDEYREKVLAMIDAKAEGEEIVAPETPEAPAPVVDLMAALEESLARAKKRSA
jgi:DNA end-binding protein Ku